MDERGRARCGAAAPAWGPALTEVKKGALVHKHRSFPFERLLDLIKRYFVIVECFFQHLPYNLPRSIG